MSNVKLKFADVIEIKYLIESTDLSYREIGAKYGVSLGCIHDIAIGKSWQPITVGKIQRILKNTKTEEKKQEKESIHARYIEKRKILDDRESQYQAIRSQIIELLKTNSYPATSKIISDQLNKRISIRLIRHIVRDRQDDDGRYEYRYIVTGLKPWTAPFQP